MFGKGNWSIFGVEPDSLATFKETLEDQFLLLELSQIRASYYTKYKEKPSVGINPFDAPRVDEKAENLDHVILAYLDCPEDTLSSPEFLPLTEFAGSSAKDFQIDEDGHCFGLWFVLNEFEDTMDVASKKEQSSYDMVTRPYKFLIKEEKKAVDAAVKASNSVVRKQFPVLIDFSQGRVYALTTVQDEILLLQETLKKMGADTFGIHWNFGDCNWPSRFLNYVRENTLKQHSDAMAHMADELTRFTKKEVPALDDKVMDRIVKNYFALAPLDTERWAALKAPAKIRLYKTSDPLTCAGPSEAFSLFQFSDQAEAVGAGVVIQSLSTRVQKGVDVEVRKDLFSVQIDSNMNLQDAGAALLRGFDMPAYKSTMRKEIKESRGQEVPISKYWIEWLREMRVAVLGLIEDLSETLFDLDDEEKKEAGLKKYDFETSEDSIEII